jgi:hypothetical protein
MIVLKYTVASSLIYVITVFVGSQRETDSIYFDLSEAFGIAPIPFYYKKFLLFPADQKYIICLCNKVC